jgi:hypothetical protein
MKKQAEERTLHRMAKVHNFLEIWQGSQTLHTSQKERQAQNTQRTAMGYISDTEESGKASWSLFQHELKQEMFGKSEKSTVIQSDVTRVAYLKAFRTWRIGFTGMGTWIIQMTSKMIARQMLNLIWSKTIASRIWNLQWSGM